MLTQMGKTQMNITNQIKNFKIYNLFPAQIVCDFRACSKNTKNRPLHFAAVTLLYFITNLILLFKNLKVLWRTHQPLHKIIIK